MYTTTAKTKAIRMELFTLSNVSAVPREKRNEYLFY